MTEKLTEKEQNFVKELANNGGNGTQAALKAYDTNDPASAASIASRKAKKPAVQSALEKELESQNITIERAIKPIADALDDEDINVRLKGSDRALKLLMPNQSTNIGVNLNIDVAHFGGECVVDAEEADETD